MALVRITHVEVLNNPSRFTDPFQFDITFECLQELQDDLEWKVIYVGSAESEQYDQELESILVGPVPVGCNKFTFQANAPDPARLPPHEVLGVTVVLLTCSYKNQEFIRVGYYVSNEFIDPAMNENPPAAAEVDISTLSRNILESKPRVTRFAIQWDGSDDPYALAQSIAQSDHVLEQYGKYVAMDLGDEEAVAMAESEGVREGEEVGESEDVGESEEGAVDEQLLHHQGLVA